MDELSSNSTLSHYRIVSKLGAGGMGEVWLAEDTRLDRRVALKLLPAAFTQDAERVRRFMQEAKAASALNHPNIITVYDIGECQAGRFIVMEFVNGRTLRGIIDADNSTETLLKLGTQMARALSAAHTAGIVHRDIKPDNIMVRDDGYVKMLDFGLARLLPTTASDPEAPTLAQQTTPGMVMGTVAYMSPEQASGQSVGSPSDVFSLGTVLFELATGQHPVKAETMLGYLHAITSKPPPSLSDLRPGLPAALDSLIVSMLEKEPRNRPSAAEVAQALHEIERYGTSSSLRGRSTPGKSSEIREPVNSEAARIDEGFWIAVLPFKLTGSSNELEALASGMTDEIVTGLSRFPYLRVISRASTLKYASISADVREIGNELGARYVMEGSIRKAGPTVRLTVQLVDATNGAHLWAETYDRHFQPDQIFAMQDDLVPRIVSTCGDHFGVLARSISDAVRGKDSSQLSPYEAVMRGFGYHHRLTAVEHAAARDALEQAVRQAPNNADCWAMLSWIYSHEYAHGFNTQPGALDRALAAARRAVDLAPSNHLAYQTLAVALFFRKDIAGCLSAAERSITLNPLDASNEAIFLITFTGDWKRGSSLISRAMELNPHHPGWYRLVLGLNHYRKAKYREAVDEAVTANAPDIFWTNVVLSAAFGQLGEHEAARNRLQTLLAQKEDFAESARETLAKWLDAEFVEHLMDGLRKAGLDTGLQIVDEEEVSNPTATQMADPEAVPGFADRPAIAVLPFDNLSSDPEQEYFADGLAEDLITRLSLWRSFPVIARNSSFVYKGKAVDVKKVSADLGVRYVVEGSVRKVGNQVRIAAQLIDATTSQHVWAKTYDRELTDVFAVQDEISSAIAASLAGDLQRAEHGRVQHRSPENLEAWGLYQRALPLVYGFTREASAQARALLERATALDPQFSTALARLAEVGIWDFIFGWTDSPQQTLDTAVAHARRAVGLDPRDAEARAELAFALMTAGFGEEALEAARHGLDLNPCMPFAMIVEGYLRNLSGNPPEESIELMERAMRLSPHDPTEFLFYDILSAAYMNAGRYAEGLAAGRRLVALMPNYYWGYLWSAMNAVGLGRLEDARAMVHDARQVHPGLTLTLARQALGAMSPEVDRRFSEALRQAGLEEEREETRRDDAGETRRKQSEIQREMAAPQTVPGFGGRPAIAVLPFNNLSGDPEQEYFAEGLAEDLITRLSLWRSFPVIARNSSFVYKGKDLDVKKVSADLGVRYVVEGSVRKVGNRVRISAQLIDATTGQHVWAKTYDRELTDVFAVQDEISEAIAASLVGDLERAEHERAKRRAPDNLEAWELYQRALPLIHRFTREDNEQSRALLERAVALDPQFSPALARLAEVGVWKVIYEWTEDPEQTLDDAIAQARHAVTLDPLDAQAHANLSFALMTAGDGHGALEEARRAVELNPSMPFALAIHAYHRHMAGHEPEESIGFVQRAMRLSPHDPVEWLFYDVLAGAYLNAGRFAEGLEAGRRLITLSPNYYWGYLWSAMNAVGLGQIEEARNLIREARRVKPELSFELAQKCLGTMAPDVDRRFSEALRQAGLEEAQKK